MINSSLIDSSVRAASKPLMLETSSQLAAAASKWRDCEILGVDTEFLRERTYRAELGLVQVSDGNTAWLIDTVRIDDFEPLKQLFTSAGILKVLHSSSEDLEVLWNTFGVSPHPMMDTQTACAMLGQPLQMSYHNAVKWMIGIEVDKDQTRSNWIRRPLKPAQLHYAATDVVFLPSMAAKMKHELEQLGRWQWLEEDVAWMLKSSKTPIEPDRAYLRFNRTHQLDPPSLNALKALAAWREKSAIQRNLARGFVISDTSLMQLAKRMPVNVDELHEIEGLHPNTVKRHQSTLLKIIEQNREKQEILEQNYPMSSRQRQLLTKMREVVKQEAGSLQVDPALLASRRLLETLIRSLESGGPVPDRLTGWRNAVITGKLLALAANGYKG